MKVDDEYERDEAILKIQKYYKAYKGREAVDRLRQEELFSLEWPKKANLLKKIN